MNSMDENKLNRENEKVLIKMAIFANMKQINSIALQFRSFLQIKQVLKLAEDKWKIFCKSIEFECVSVCISKMFISLCVPHMLEKTNVQQIQIRWIILHFKLYCISLFFLQKCMLN